MSQHLHVVAILAGMAGYQTRYTRVPEGLSDEAVFEHVRAQVDEHFPTETLLFVVHDEDHVHPPVIMDGGLRCADVHMP